MTTDPLATFIDYWDVSPAVGTRLEIMDREDFDVYDCTVTRIENGQIYIL
jgi:hypothetical protein